MYAECQSVRVSRVGGVMALAVQWKKLFVSLAVDCSRSCGSASKFDTYCFSSNPSEALRQRRRYRSHGCWTLVGVCHRLAAGCNTVCPNLRVCVCAAGALPSPQRRERCSVRGVWGGWVMSSTPPYYVCPHACVSDPSGPKREPVGAGKVTRGSSLRSPASHCTDAPARQ